MFRRLLAGVLVASTSWVAIPVALMHAVSPAGANPPAAVQQCRLADADQRFRIEICKPGTVRQLHDPPSC
jgi:hypothetical protein